MQVPARDTDGQSGHSADFMCYVCGEAADVHDDPGEYVDCISCTTSMNLHGVKHQHLDDVPEETKVQCMR